MDASNERGRGAAVGAGVGAAVAARRRGPFRDFGLLVWRSLNGWVDDRASSMGAAIAYYTALSLAPLLLIVVAIAGVVFGRDAAQGAIVVELQGIVGTDGARTIQSILASSQSLKGGILSIVIGSAVLLVGATTVFAELQADIDLIWHAKPRAGNGVLNFLRARLLSFGLVLGVGFLLIVSLLVSTAISAFSTFWGGWLVGEALLASSVNFVVSFGFITVLFALIFKFLPTAVIGWRDVWIGAAVTSLLFSVGKSAIGLYLGRSAVSSSFGAAGAFVVLIVWIYYAAQIFLLGAEFTYQYALMYGSRSAEVPSNGAAAQPAG